ncbi:MAG: hypothetical protein A3G34_09290 [Candidatus Lindowbacteria bacterium RIFCSPLOWO2_12_FULL_62_27]|nr:MAG: hypothetical protein A3I06_07955 [Candidatus Lindowbacteria bacterium RIFCSPLOWO2_02_FULL_62_12]OGH60231.1 MAG: hypothetical protein A3G34_09290 [Candidatus Lindowbacteria bacterium RIFCSPLOWO2_12_FULL_62_27]
MSLNPDSKAAAAEALGEAVQPLPEPAATAAWVFGTSHHSKSFQEILDFLRSKIHIRALFGATGAGIIGPRGEVESEPGLSILLMSSDRVTAGAAMAPDLRSDAVQHLRGELPSLYRERGVLFLTADPRSLHPGFLSRMAHAFPETPVVGAAAGWSAESQVATIAADGESSHHGCAALHLAGCVEASIGVAHAVLPESEPRPITSASDNRIAQIDHEPAADVLAAFVQEQRKAHPQQDRIDIFCALADSLKDYIAGRYIVRSILAVELATQHVSVAEPVRAGQFICFGVRSARGSRRTFRQMLERLSGGLSGRAPRATVIFNCCARGLSLYGRPHVDLDAYREFFPELPVAGLFGFAEIGPIHWDGRKVRSAILNHTAVLTLLTEPMEALGAT